MTKEKLKKEAEEWLCNNLHSASEEDFIKVMIDIAEPREKRIEELKRQLDLKEKALSKAKKETKRIADRVNKDKRRLIRRKKELEAQIEKMKCCGNCIHCKYDENEDSYEWCEVHDQIVNIAIKPCYAYEMIDLDKAIKEIKEK